jgi:hypothetical protein
MRLLRDTSLLDDVQGIHPVILIGINQESTVYPKSGIIPFQGLSYLVAPFCYMSTDLEEVYHIFKAFYSKYLSYLYSFTTDKNSALTLIYNFNIYFELHLSDLKRHFRKINFDVNVLAMTWFTSCFGFIVSPNSMFIIYDIILLVDGLEILPLLALSILWSKRYILLDISDGNAVEICFDNIRFENINVVDVLFNYLKSFNTVIDS